MRSLQPRQSKLRLSKVVGGFGPLPFTRGVTMVEYTCRCGNKYRMSMDSWIWHRLVECEVWRRIYGYIR